MLYFEFSLIKFQNLNFHFNNFMKQYFPNSNIIIITYPCLYLYIQHTHTHTHTWYRYGNSELVIFQNYYKTFFFFFWVWFVTIKLIVFFFFFNLFLLSFWVGQLPVGLGWVGWLEEMGGLRFWNRGVQL